MRLLPPKETKGSGTPVTGEDAHDRADVDDRLHHHERREAGGEHLLVQVAGPDGDAVAGQREEPEGERSTPRMPITPSSSPTVARIMSVWASGR